MSRSMPGAVPSGLGMIRLPRGNIACRRLLAGIGALRRANRDSTAARAAASSSSGAPPRAASTSRVRSSAVGPRPPVARTKSARPVAMRNASMPASRVSGAVVWKATGIPIVASSADSQRLLVSSR